MFKNLRKKIKSFDYVLIGIILVIISVGVSSIYSAGYDPQTGTSKEYWWKQLAWFGISCIFFVAASFVSYRKAVKYAPIFYLFGCGLLLAVMLKGEVGMGAQRWLDIGIIRLQPSEVFKVIWAISLAWIFYDFNTEPMGLFRLLWKAMPMAVPFVLIFKQPDLGTALTFVAVWGIVVYILGIRRRTLTLLIILFLISLPVVWSHMQPYQKARVFTFIDPESDPYGAGYHILQSMIAVGSGGVFGKGYLDGTQSQLKFVPERHTDFIFSAMNEEFGLVGGVLLITLFTILISRIAHVSQQIKEPSGKILCLAIAGFFFFQFFVNAGMTLGMMPVVGIPMPMISYGGTSLVSFMTMLGLVNSVYMRRFDGPTDD